MSKNEDKKNNKDDLESKKGKTDRNEWRKLISIIFAGITLYLLFTYNLFDYTGYIIGFLIVIILGVIINFIIDKLFYFFMD